MAGLCQCPRCRRRCNRVWSHDLHLSINVQMREPSLRTSRLVIAGSFVAAVAIATVGFLVGRASSPQPRPFVEVRPEPTAPASLEPEQPRILERADLMALAGRAADASASRLALPADILGLVGRRFELAIPFGCDGPSAVDANAPFSWRYDAKGRTLRIRVSPTTWSMSDWGFTGPPTMNPTAEGFWISRPWSSSESCPENTAEVAVPDARPVTLPGQTLAVAQFKTDAPDRGSVRGPRSFDAVKRFAPEQLNTSRGFRLKLVGRLDRLPDGRPVRCIQPAGSEQRPICVLAIAFEELRIENPASDDVLAVWSIGRSSQAD